MKIRNLIIGGVAISCLCLTAAHSAYVFKKSKEFEKKMDLSEDSLDEMVAFGGKKKNYSDQKMKDLKVGAFCGGMDMDLSEVVADEGDYRMDIEIHNGGINVVIPRNFKLNLVDRVKFGGVNDETICEDPKNAVSLSVRADVCFGGLNFENPQN
jgi:predicted membrane protein